MNELSEPYVKLVLALGTHDPLYVDAYYGPPAWQREVETTPPTLAAIRQRATELLDRLRGEAKPTEHLLAQRHTFLGKQLEAMLARVDLLQGVKLSFDEESRRIYDAVAPVVTEAELEKTLARLDQLLPGPAPLPERVEALRGRMAIPPDRLDAVFSAAIAECRRLTAQHVTLPDGESFTVEYVTGKPWSAYNWYKGDYRSIIQVNTDLPVFIDRAIDLGCHEGYPGHHVYNALLEQHLGRERGWVETTVYPLYSPMSLIAEGSANYGIHVAFPAAERERFETQVLYPLAGLDPALAPTYNKLLDLLADLKHADNQAARRLLDGEIDADAAVAYLTRYALLDPARARKKVSFAQTYRSYVINYNLGQDLVAGWIQRQGGDPWVALVRMLSMPMVASDLVAQ